ncbi:MAG: pyridoxal-dependent decarboxylase [Actinomycetota bacterium]|nr:pyridoxal-dependent decarboxylase [Actinomycetota bacterium]
MTDPIQDLNAYDQMLDLLAEEAKRYLADLPEAPLRTPDADATADGFQIPFLEDGKGAVEALQTLLSDGMDAHVRSSGPRFFHFVVGGVTPAAFGAEWIAGLIDQNPGLWPASPLGARLEAVSLEWLKDLFELPAEWGATLTTGGTMANYVGLGAGRRWWGLQQDHDIERLGMSALPPLPVFSSGILHASSVKVLGMLGVGRDNIQQFSADASGRVDLNALEDALKKLNGAPAIVIANAGEVNSGAFDPIEAMADLAERYNSWLHVDGAFGLFARISPRSRHLTEGVERAHSVAADGHKWLNVPQDCGFAFVRDASLIKELFAAVAAYLGNVEDPHPNPAFTSPESSQRARGLAVWATLRAYGRSGYRAMVERHLELAQRIAQRVDEAEDLERLADVPLNIVCFRYRPPGVDESELDDLNTRLGKAVLDDRRVYFGTTVYEGKVALRPAIVNWRTTERDVDLLVDVVRELGGALQK